MTSICRTITDFLSTFLLKKIINVAISSFVECVPVESRFPPPFPQILCVGVGVWVWVGGCANACLYKNKKIKIKNVSVYVSE